MDVTQPELKQTELKQAWYQRIHWPTATFLVATPIVAFTVTPIYVAIKGIPWAIVFLAIVYGMITNLAITAGYHRLFAHRSYQAHPLVKVFYLLVGAAAFQGSVLGWATDHRRHHRSVDTNEDPYSIKKGFFFAHIGWLLLKQDAKYKDVYANDLKNDRLVWWQHQYYVPLAFLMSFGVPTLVGWFLGSAWAGFIVGGVLRVVFTQHSTFLINSACHMIGKQPYNDKNSAKDNAVLAFFTCGEGYHNFHHRFASDYRNGIRWYDWDPTKWWIRFLSFFKLTSRLNRIPATEILKARLTQEQRHLQGRGVPTETLLALRNKIEEAQTKVKHLRTEYKKLKATIQAESRKLHVKAELKVARLEFKMAYAQWLVYTRTLKTLPVTA